MVEKVWLAFYTGVLLGAFGGIFLMGLPSVFEEWRQFRERNRAERRIDKWI